MIVWLGFLKRREEKSGLLMANLLSAKVFMDALEELFSVDRNTWRAVLKKKHMKYQILDCYKCDDINVNKGRIEVDAKEYFRIYSMLVDCDVSNIDRNTWITEGFQFFANLSKNTTDDNSSEEEAKEVVVTVDYVQYMDYDRKIERRR